MTTFILNNQTIETPLPSGTTVLDFVRYHRHLVGTKIGCREGDCGACTVLVGEIYEGELRYRSMTSCLMPLSNAHNKHIVTVEGVNTGKLTPIQQAIVEEGGSQCGFCTVGFVMSLTGFTLHQPAELTGFGNLSALALASIDGNICRCTGYKSIERAAEKIAARTSEAPDEDRMEWLVANNFLPNYFLEIKSRLKALPQPTEIPSPNGRGIITGGGTDLWVQRPEEMVESRLQPVFDRTEWNQIYEEDGDIYIGASATASDTQKSPLLQSIFPRLHDHMKLVSSTPIRNMGTLGGNLVNASPIGDLIIFFLALDSHITLNRNGQRRTIPLRKFYLSYKTLDKAPDEVVESLSFAKPGPDDHFNFEKVCKRTHLDIASVNSACLLQIDGDTIRTAHLSAGGVGPIPMYLEQASAALQGQKITPELIKKTALIIDEEISPISDARGSSDYKRLLLRQLFFGHFMEWEDFRVRLGELV